MRPRCVYQLFPLGVCGVLVDSGPIDDLHRGHPTRLRDVVPWLDHLVSLGADTLLLGPVFSSSDHGYDTIDPAHVDPRLGDDDDLVLVVQAAHARGIEVVLDAVFNHLGRDSAPFRALVEASGGGVWRERFAGVRDGTSPLGDPFEYDSWAGHASLPRLNTDHPEVRGWWADVVRDWYRRFDIDGLRLDAADCLSADFIRFIAAVARAEKPDTWLVGEVVHGDYRERLGDGLLDSITNYELYKSLWSGIESRCMFETAYALDRQSGPEGLYRDHALLTFVDNHDVNRLASTLTRPSALYPAWGVMMTMPGIPTVYYGSEFGQPGTKGETSDAPLRPALDLAACGHDAERRGPAARDLLATIRRLSEIRNATPALQTGRYEELFIGDTTLAFRRVLDDADGGGECVVVVNAGTTAQRLRPGRGLRRHSPVGVRAWDDDKRGHCRGLPLADGTWTDLLNPHRQVVSSDGLLDVEVPPDWLMILQRQH